MTDRELLELIVQKVTKMDGDIVGIKGDISGMKDEITGLKGEVTDIKGDITGIKSEITGLKNEVTNIKSDIIEIKDDIKDLKQRQDRMEIKLSAVSDQTAILTEFRTDVISRLDSNAEIQKSLLEMYGGHEAEIRSLRRRSG